MWLRFTIRRRSQCWEESGAVFEDRMVEDSSRLCDLKWALKSNLGKICNYFASAICAASKIVKDCALLVK